MYVILISIATLLVTGFVFWVVLSLSEHMENRSKKSESETGDGTDRNLKQDSNEMQQVQGELNSGLNSESQEEKVNPPLDDVIIDVVRSSAEQSRAMLKTLKRLETERDLLKKELEAQMVDKKAAFKKLAHIPDESNTDRRDDELYEQLYQKTKRLKNSCTRLKGKICILKML